MKLFHKDQKVVHDFCKLLNLLTPASRDNSIKMEGVVSYLSENGK